MLMDAPCPAQTQVEKSKMTVKRTPESEGKNSRDDTLQENTEHFFVTQVCISVFCGFDIPPLFQSQHLLNFILSQATDVPQCEFDLQADDKEIAENKHDANSERFTCYKMLMDAKPDPDDVVEPISEDCSFNIQLFIFGHFSQVFKSLAKQVPHFFFQQEFKQLFGCWNTH